jgi:Ca2+-binding RTX toxin-like protein
MARALLSFLIALALAACGSTLALANEDEDVCAADGVAAAAQVEDDLGEDEFLDEEDESVDEGDDWLEEDEGWVDEEDWTDGEDFEVPDDEVGGCDQSVDDEFADDDATEGIDDGPNAGELRSDGRTRRGGRGPDRFIGDSGVNRFFGGGGDDYLDGRGGRDLLNGGADDDTIITGKRKAGAAKRKRASKKGAEVNAGKGDDVVRARNGRVDKIHCGRGADVVLADRGDKVRRKNCETVNYG